MAFFFSFIFRSILPAVLLLLFNPSLSYADYRERILSYHSDIHVLSSGTMDVTETIKVNAQNQQINRGIYRDFPTKYKDRHGNSYVVGFEVLDIRRDGLTDNYHFGSLPNGRRIYIGNANYILSPGEYTYTITYRTTRQLGFFKDHDELYWNVTGNGWAFPIDEAEAVVYLPKDAANSSELQTSAYIGLYGSREDDVTMEHTDDGGILFRSNRPLSGQEGLTIVTEWPKGYVRAPTTADKIEWFIEDNKALIVGFFGLGVVLIYYFLAWLFFGKDPQKGTIIPLYYPPKEFTPAMTRYLTEMGYDNKAFTAAIINMAVKGYLKIEEGSGKEYTLIRTDATDAGLSEEERALAKALFNSQGRFSKILSGLVTGFNPGIPTPAAQGETGSITLKDSNYQQIQDAMREFKRVLEKKLDQSYFVTNAGYFAVGLLASMGLVVAVCFLSGNESDIFTIIFTVFVTSIFGSVVFSVFNKLSSLKNSSLGGFKWVVMILPFLPLLFIFFIFGQFSKGLFTGFVGSISVWLAVLVVAVNICFYYLLKAPTMMGRKTLDQIEGFKMYLSTAEKDRLNFENPPGKTPETFEKYLPYALALGVEQQWSQQFADVLSKAAVGGTTYHPGWYSGNNWNQLGPSRFASSLGGAFSSAIASASTPPGSSSGGGGGGHSGGGGGGGGGGGW